MISPASICPAAGPRVLALLSTDDACAWYRIVSPFSVLRDAGWPFEWMRWEQFHPDMLSRFDLLVLPRIKPGDMAMIDAISQYPAVYEVDDDFTCTQERNDLLESLWGVCRAVTVTTPALADVMRPFNPEVFVLPNCLDLTVWNKNRRPVDGRVLIGITGGSNHYDDWKLVMPVLKEICRVHPEARIGPAGYLPDFMEKELGPARIVKFPYVPYARLPETVCQFDIGIAPLADTRFNKSKSPVKVLEYMASGVPWVASAVGPYLTMPHGKTGFATASPDGFRDALELLICNPGLRSDLGAAGAVWVRKHADIRNHAIHWVETYQKVLGGQKATARRSNHESF
ncbi:MAG: glycosyltransferase [bacterium]